MEVSRRGILQAGVPLALGATVAGPQDPTIRLYRLAAGAGDGMRRFEDFGAKGDYDVDARTGTDDTRSIQAAVDWAHGGGRGPARAILVEPKNYLCGPITTYPYTTLVGSGRQTSNFFCRPGTRGAWWSDRGNGAQKLMLSGLAWYGNGETGLDGVCRFGRDGIQFGSEGILQGLWMRDAPRAIGLDLSGNVGIVRDVTLQTLDTGIAVYGNGNQLENIISMQARIGAKFYGSFVRGLHVEAVSTDGLPLFLNGDCRVSDVMFSLAAGTQFDHLIEVDDATYGEWSIRNVQIFARTASVRQSLLKVGGRDLGGKSLDHPLGIELVPTLDIHSASFSVAGQRWQNFAIQLDRRNGRLGHAIGPIVPGTRAPGLAALVRRASADWTDTPRGATFAGGARWSEGKMVLDTPAIRGDDFALTATVLRNTTGRPVTVETGIDPNRSQLELRLWDAVTGEPWDFPAGAREALLRIGISGFGG